MTNNPFSNGRAVLWDLDGTLIDTGTVHWQAWRGVLAKEGLDLTWDKFVPGFGQRNDNVLRMWLGPDLSDAEVVRIAEIKESTYREVLKEQPPELLPGTEHWLAALRAAGWRQALATMTPRLILEAIFEVVKTSSGQSMREFFDAVVTADDVHQSKPNPEVFLLAASRLGMPPERCVVVEDSPAGVEAAFRAGMRSIGVGPKAGTAAHLITLSLADLPENAFSRLVGA